MKKNTPVWIAAAFLTALFSLPASAAGEARVVTGKPYDAELPSLGSPAGPYGKGAEVLYIDPDVPRKPYHLNGHVKRLQDAPWVQEEVEKHNGTRGYLNQPSAEDYEHWQKKLSGKKTHRTAGKKRHRK